MARASTPTLLPIDRWAELLGVHPFIWNQMYSDTYKFSEQISQENCGNSFFQHPYQNPNFTSREEIATAIREAEGMIAQAAGFYPIPTWTYQERKQTTRPAKPELIARSNVNLRGYYKSVELDHGYIISGGQRAQSLIQAGVAVAFTDSDGDLYPETATATVATAVADCEIHAYLPGRAGSYAYEIRPIVVTSTGGVATITFKKWQMVDPDLQEHLSAEDPDNRIDADDIGNYEITIDVYRIYNDPSTQVTLMWENTQVGCEACNGTGCAACSFATQTGCLFVRDERLGIVGYRPATWDSDDAAFDSADLSVCRDPEQLRLYYFSGYESTDPLIDCPRVQMDRDFEQAILRLSVTLLDRNVCSCNNVDAFVDYMREDLSRVGTDRTYQLTQRDLGNPFGPTRGAIAAWKLINLNGRRIRK